MARHTYIPPEQDSNAAITERLRLLRRAYGYTYAQMARLIGSPTAKTGGQAWEHYESGRRRITTPHAVALCNTLGASLDWIYRGYEGNLSSELRAKLEAEAKHPSSTGASRGRRSRNDPTKETEKH